MPFSIQDTITSMQNATAMNTPRNVNKEMGKNDFLALLAAQLRYQDPLEPLSDTEFVAQLAQFSSLEQMQNVNETLMSMTNFQAYGLVGKYVVARAEVDGVMSEVAGIVDCIFTNNGVTYAQLGDYPMPVGSIVQVYDSSTMLTPKLLLETSSYLIGRTVKADVYVEDEETNEDGEVTLTTRLVTHEGLVTRISADDGTMYAHIDDGSGEVKIVPVGSIYDIRMTVPAGEKTPLDDTVEDEDGAGSGTEPVDP